MSIRSMVDDYVRRQVRVKDPDDPNGWTRSELKHEVERLRELILRDELVCTCDKGDGCSAANCKGTPFELPSGEY